MGFIERVGAAMAVLRGEQPSPQRGGRKSKIFSFPTWMNMRARWNFDSTFQTTVEEGYKLNSLIYPPVRYKAQGYASIPLVAAAGDPDNPEWITDKTHPLYKLCSRPNPYQSWGAYAEQRKTYLELAGNNYTYAERSRDRTVKALYNLRPDRVRIIPDTRGVKGFYYLPPGRADVDGVPLLPEDVAHTKYPNPLDDMEGLGYGLPPLLAAARDADTDNAITSFIKVLFDRGAMPVGMLRFETSLGDEEADLAKKRFMDKHGGFEKWIEPIVMDQGGGYERIGMTFQELGFDVLDARNEARILSVFRVPPILVGTRYGLAHGTYSNYNEARRQFWEDVMLPETRLFESDDQQIMGSDSAWVMYDFASVPALQADVPALVEAAQKLWTMGVPANQAVVAVGLKIEDIPFGDKPYVAKAVREAGVEPPAPVAPDPANQSTEGEPPPAGGGNPPEEAAQDVPKASAPRVKDAPAAGYGKEDKARLWKAMDDIALAHEAAFHAEAARQFEIDKRDLLAAVGEAKRRARRAKATVDWTPVLTAAEDIINAAGDRWREAFAPIVSGVVTDVAGFWQIEAGLVFDVTRLEDQAFFIDYMADFWDKISLTSRQDIMGVIQRGIAEGWSIEQMQNGLTALFDQWISGNADPAQVRFATGRLEPWRTELIARTESTKAMNWGSFQVYAANEVERKEWLYTQDNRTRDSHKSEADGGVGGQIRPMNEPFDLPGGVKMMHPGDGSFNAPVEEIANCRCAVAPVFDEKQWRVVMLWKANRPMAA